MEQSTSYKTQLIDEDGQKLSPKVMIDQVFMQDEETSFWNQYQEDLSNTTDKSLIEKLGFSKEESRFFNWATVIRDEIGKDGLKVHNIEYWLLINARYDESSNRFKRIDMEQTSFGLQFQAQGTFPGEAQLGFGDNQGCTIWRTFKKKDIESMGFTATEDIGYESNGQWIEFATVLGWNNSYMIDSYGGMTIGGAGFELDGNGLFPYTRVTASKYTKNEQEFAIQGLLVNGYHSLSGADNPKLDSLFLGFRSPVTTLTLPNGSTQANVVDTKQAHFVVMRAPAQETPVESYINSWVTIMDFPLDGSGSQIATKPFEKCSVPAPEESKMEGATTAYVQFNYPDSFTKDNTIVTGVKFLQNGGLKGGSLERVIYSDSVCGVTYGYDAVKDQPLSDVQIIIGKC